MTIVNVTYELNGFHVNLSLDCPDRVNVTISTPKTMQKKRKLIVSRVITGSDIITGAKLITDTTGAVQLGRKFAKILKDFIS